VRNTIPHTTSISRTYTHAKFGEIQNEFRSKMNCVIKRVNVNGFVSNYNTYHYMLLSMLVTKLK